MALRILACILFFAAAVPPAAADTADPVYNRIAFSETARRDVDNDILVATLFAQREGRRSATLAGTVNGIVERAVERARATAGVKVQTLSYRTNAIYSKGSVTGWRVSQSIRLESRDSKVLGDLVGALQEEMQVQSIGYQVSEENRRSHVGQLVDAALERFRERAEQVRQTMGRSSYRVVRININTGEGGPVLQPRSMLRAEMAMAAAPPPRIEAGTQSVSVRVDGEIELSND